MDEQGDALATHIDDLDDVQQIKGGEAGGKSCLLEEATHFDFEQVQIDGFFQVTGRAIF